MEGGPKSALTVALSHRFLFNDTVFISVKITFKILCSI